LPRWQAVIGYFSHGSKDVCGYFSRKSVKTIVTNFKLKGVLVIKLNVSAIYYCIDLKMVHKLIQEVQVEQEDFWSNFMFFKFKIQ